MENTMLISKTVSFAAPAAQVWNLITNPEMTRQYMFGCEVLSDWQVGSPVLWKGKNEEGQEVTFVKGTVTESAPGQKVSFTMLDPNVGIADIPENYARLTYQVQPAGEGATLQILQDFSGTENGQERYEESLAGWDHVIGLMKKLMQ